MVMIMKSTTSKIMSLVDAMYDIMESHNCVTPDIQERINMFKNDYRDILLEDLYTITNDESKDASYRFTKEMQI